MNDDFNFRDLTIEESNIIKSLLSVDFEGKDIIAEQIRDIKVKTIDKEGSLEFKTKSKFKANVKRRIPIEAIFLDSDGVKGHILLHIVNGIIKELEIFKEDSSEILDKINPSKIQLLKLD